MINCFAQGLAGSVRVGILSAQNPQRTADAKGQP